MKKLSFILAMIICLPALGQAQVKQGDRWDKFTKPPKLADRLECEKPEDEMEGRAKRQNDRLRQRENQLNKVDGGLRSSEFGVMDLLVNENKDNQ
jgi:hypothetical protein